MPSSEDSFNAVLDFVAHQLSKDLNHPFSAEPLLLSQELALYCEELSREGYSKIAQTLYKVDVSEDVLIAELQERTHESEAKLLARIILKRELQKVLFRLSHASMSLEEYINRILSP